MADDVRESLRAALRDWRQKLLPVAALPTKRDMDASERAALERSVDPEQLFWIRCQDIDSTAAMEAVELLALLARVDYPLWTEFVAELWPGDPTWTDFFETRTSLRLGFRLILADDDDIAFNCKRVVNAITGPRSGAYRSTYALMERALGEPLVSLPVIPFWLSCYIFDEGRDFEAEEGSVPTTGQESEDEHEADEGTGREDQDEGGPVARLLTSIRTLLARQPSEGESVMRVTRFSLGLDYMSIGEAAVGVLAAIRALGIQVEAMPSLQLDVTGRKRRHVLRTVRSLLNAASVVRVDATPTRSAHPTGVEHFTIRKLGARMATSVARVERLVPSILSAVQASDSLRHISVDFEHEWQYSEFPRKQMVWWQTYGVFCRSPLETVDINVDRLRVEDIEWMAQIWNALNPLAMLFPEETGGSGIVTASRVYLRDPTRGTAVSTPSTWEEPSPIALEVVGESRGGFLPVLLPGWGKAWVKEEECKFVPSESAKRPTFQFPTHIVIRRPTSYEVVLALLRLVGRDLKHLVFRGTSSSDSPLKPVFAEHLLRACPQLEELEIPGLCGLQPITDAIRSGECAKLQHLKLSSFQIREDGEIERLLEALADRHDPVAKQLRTLDLSLAVKVQRIQLDAALTMLRMNNQLRDVVLSFKCDRALVDEYSPLFLSLHKSRAIEPLPLRSVFAFLSTVRTGIARDTAAHGQDARYQALEQFDTRILSLVIAFAAEPHARWPRVILH